MAFELPPLPYPSDALEPHMSATTFNFHHAKHHKAYVDNLNKALPGTEYESLSLVDIIKASESKTPAVFNNAAQVWNHTFFWHCMKPGGGGQPTGRIADKINEDFGSYEAFAEQFKNAGVTQFGSGWAWLVVGPDGKLKVTKTPNGENPLTREDKPILTVDVWEHAYYLDYQNMRPKFIDVFLESLVNWDFVNERLDAPLYDGLS